METDEGDAGVHGRTGRPASIQRDVDDIRPRLVPRPHPAAVTPRGTSTGIAPNPCGTEVCGAGAPAVSTTTAHRPGPVHGGGSGVCGERRPG